MQRFRMLWKTWCDPCHPLFCGYRTVRTFCLVDTCLVLAAKGKEVNMHVIRSTLLKMRTQRMGLIQTDLQLRFLWWQTLSGMSRLQWRTNSTAVRRPTTPPPTAILITLTSLRRPSWTVNGRRSQRWMPRPRPAPRSGKTLILDRFAAVYFTSRSVPTRQNTVEFFAPYPTKKYNTILT